MLRQLARAKRSAWISVDKRMRGWMIEGGVELTGRVKGGFQMGGLHVCFLLSSFLPRGAPCLITLITLLKGRAAVASGTPTRR